MAGLDVFLGCALLPSWAIGGPWAAEKGVRCSLQAASLLGGLIGPALGGLLADMSGLRAPFTLTGCAALMAAIYGAVRLPETMGTQKSKPTGAFTGSSLKEDTIVSPYVCVVIIWQCLPSPHGVHCAGGCACLLLMHAHSGSAVGQSTTWATVVPLHGLVVTCTLPVQANSSSAAEHTGEEEATPLLEATSVQRGEAPSMEALQKPERKLKETRTFNPRKMRPKR